SKSTQTLYAEGLSGIVKETEAIFLSELEEVQIIDPSQTRLVTDTSSNFRDSKLYMESLLRKRAFSGNRLYTGHKAAMDVMDYQLEPAVKALEQTRQRVLLADGVGLGKTLEAGILVSELMARGKGKRILVVAVKSMMLQFQKEFWSRFAIPLVRLDSTKIQKIKQHIPSNHNPFYYYDKTIVSIDTLKRNLEYRTYIESARWDIIIIDEAHNVANRGASHAERSQRSKLAELLARRSDTLIMLSATPHDGRPESFASLMNMLDPTAIADEQHYSVEDISDKVFRRFKKDVQDQIQGSFKDKRLTREVVRASEAEEEVFDYFTTIKFTAIDQRRTAGKLFKTTLEKSLFSSPAACIKSVENRIKTLQKKEDPLYDGDIQQLKGFKSLLQRVGRDDFSRYQKLLELLQKGSDYGWTQSKDDRIVIFTERIETMNFLREALIKDLKLKDKEVITLYGGMSDVDQQKIVDEFGAEDSKIKILVASDVASEGINLHYFSHRMIHFDIPWSLMVFQQRNGRIDRYGQEQTPDIRYLITNTENEQIKGDLRILEILVEKEEQAEKNIGDPAVLMGKYDVEAEEEETAKAIESGISIDEFSKQLDQKETDAMKAFNDLFSGSSPIPVSHKMTKSAATIYNDLDYLMEMLNRIQTHDNHTELTYRKTDDGDGIRLNLPQKLKKRFERKLPKEVLSDEIKLTTNKERIAKAIKKSREQREDTWPDFQYLWELHPLMEWLSDKAETIFERREAPLLIYDGLKKDEHIFITAGLIPNRRSEPVIDKWYALKFEGNTFINRMDIENVLEQTLFQHRHPNAAQSNEILVKQLQELMNEAVKQTRILVDIDANNLETVFINQLKDEEERLSQLREQHNEQIDLFEKENNSAKATEIASQRRRKTKKLFDEFYSWINDTMILEKDKPYIRIIAVLSGGER
nr:DEAD/DEAH box helicase [Thermotogota bacterium]